MLTNENLARTLGFILTEDYSLNTSKQENHIFIQYKEENTIDMLVVEDFGRETRKKVEETLSTNAANGVYTAITLVKPKRKSLEKMSSFGDGNRADHQKVKRFFSEGRKTLNKIIERTPVDGISEANLNDKKILFEYNGTHKITHYSVESITDREGEIREDVQIIHKEKFSETKNPFKEENSGEFELVKGQYDKLAIIVPKETSTFVKQIKKENKENEVKQMTLTFLDLEEPQQNEKVKKQPFEFEKEKVNWSPEGFPLHPYNIKVKAYVSHENNTRKRLDVTFIGEFHKAYAYHFAIKTYLEALDAIQPKKMNLSINHIGAIVSIPETPHYFEKHNNTKLTSRSEFKGSDANYLEHIQLLIEPTMMNYLERAEKIKSGEIILEKKYDSPNPQESIEEETESNVNEIDNYFSKPNPKDISNTYLDPKGGIVKPLQEGWQKKLKN